MSAQQGIVKNSARLNLSQLPQPTTMHPQLPHEILVLVLQCMPLNQRLGSCSLVNKSWATAAAEATYLINSESLSSKYNSSSTTLRNLLQWLSKHGQHVEDIYLMAPDSDQDQDRHLSELPCPNLLQLALGGGFSMQLAPSSTSPGLLSTATELIDLQIWDCSCTDGWAGLDAIAALTDLEHLDLTFEDLPAALQPAHHSSSKRQAGAAARCSSQFLSSLQQLTHLDLSNNLGCGTLQPLSCLTNLEELNLKGLYDDFVLSDLAGLQYLQQLTALDIHYAKVSFSTSGTPGLMALTQLQHLTLNNCDGLEPAVLQPLTALQHLELYCVQLTGSPQALSAFLSWLPKLQQLTLLEARDVENAGMVMPPAAAFYSLTANTKLRSLSFEFQFKTRGLTSAAVWQKMFPAKHVLPHLTSLTAMVQDFQAQRTDLQRLQQCCPALQYLLFRPHDQSEWDLHSTVHTWRSLRWLSTQSVSDVCMESIAKLTQLESLDISYPHTITAHGLLQVTSLRKLTQLSVRWIGGSLHDFGHGDDHLSFENKAEAAEPDVWYQILLSCARNAHDSDVTKPAAQEVCTLLDQSRTDLAHCQAALAQSQSDLAHKDAELQRAQAELALLRQQLAQL